VLLVNYFDSAISTSKLERYFCASIERSIIYDNKFKVTKGLVGDTLNCISNVLPAVE
jgi:hypothetical protein